MKNRVKKSAMNLDQGDIVFTLAGERLGMVVADPYIFKGYESVEFDVAQDDEVNRQRCAPGDKYLVESWFPSSAV